MINRSPIGIVLVLALWAASGCAPVWVATGAVVGYAVSRDSAIVDLDQPWSKVWKACVEEMKFMGHLKREDSKRARLDARVEDADVILTLKQLSPSTVRVAIRARRILLPKPEIAQRLSVGIVRRVK